MVKRMKTILQNKKYSNGFSLIEASVVMLIVSIFVAASAQVFTKKNIPTQEKTPHGRFECFYIEEQLYQRYTYESTSRTAQPVDKCVFRPVSSAPYYVLNTVGGGGGGSMYFGGSAGKYSSTFLPGIDENLIIEPGLGGDVGAPGTKTIITNKSDELLVLVDGGKGGFPNSSISFEMSDIDSCSTIITNQTYLNYCTEVKQPTCTVHAGGTYISFNYCYSSSTLYNNNTNWKNFTLEKGEVATGYSNVTLSIKMKEHAIPTNMTQLAQQSALTRYINAAGYNTVVKNPGDGGGLSEPGNPGSVLIVW